MSWFGKVVGGTFGLFLGGPLGAIAGAALGHLFVDNAQEQVREQPGGRPRFTASAERVQAAYFIALFSLLGKIAKADGRVTKDEGDMVVRFLDQMRVSGRQRQFAIQVFNEAKDIHYTVEELAQQFRQVTGARRDLRFGLVEMLFQVAMVDGTFHPQEEAQIRRVAGVVGLSEYEWNTLYHRYVPGSAARPGASGPSLAEHYETLGVGEDATDEEVRRAYRRLAKENHPDALISKGLPEEFVEYATERFQRIQNAWDAIKKERNL
ncbi:MAG: co-chaperone DjlA [Alkalispirochaetaceae bacterium]